MHLEPTPRTVDDVEGHRAVGERLGPRLLARRDAVVQLRGRLLRAEVGKRVRWTRVDHGHALRAKRVLVDGDNLRVAVRLEIVPV